MIPNLDLSAVPTPRLTFARDIKEFPRLKEGVSLCDFTSSAAFQREAIDVVATAVRIYEAAGFATQVIIPEAYAEKLDRIAELQMQALSNHVRGEKAKAELNSQPWNELVNRLTVADAYRYAQMTPDPSLFREIRLLETENPYDGYYGIKTGNPDFKSAADTVFKYRQTNWYKKDLGPSLFEDTMHEWAHLFEEAYPLAANVIRIATKVDTLKTRSYASVPREELAILVGEYALHETGHRVHELIDAAPVTSLAIARGLKQVLERVSPESQSALHDQLKARSKRMEELTESIARKSLVKKIQEGSDTAGVNAALRALVHLGEEEDLRGLSVERLNFGYEPIGDSIGRRLGKLQCITDLNLEYTSIGPDTLRALESMPLHRLNLAGTKVSNSSLCFLPLSLLELDLSGTRIGDAAVLFLGRLQKLTTLDVSGTQISASGLDELKSALPNTEVDATL